MCVETRLRLRRVWNVTEKQIFLFDKLLLLRIVQYALARAQRRWEKLYVPEFDEFLFNTFRYEWIRVLHYLPLLPPHTHTTLFKPNLLILLLYSRRFREKSTNAMWYLSESLFQFRKSLRYKPTTKSIKLSTGYYNTRHFNRIVFLNVRTG